MFKAPEYTTMICIEVENLGEPMDKEKWEKLGLGFGVKASALER